MGADIDDAYLVQRAREGYVDAYAELVDRHGQLAYRVALRIRSPTVLASSPRRGLSRWRSAAWRSFMAAGLGRVRARP